MSDTLVENGKEYVRVKAAAPTAGISADYITKLCRSGAVSGLRTQGGWFVDPVSLEAFLKKQAEEKEERRKQQADDLRHMQGKAGAVGPAEMTGGGSAHSDLLPTPPTSSAPRRELNARFQSHIRKAQRVRAVSTAFFATLAVLAVVGGGALAFHDIAPDAFARATAAPNKVASQLAAASSLPWLDAVGDKLFNILCPIFRDCPRNDVIANPVSQPRAAQPLPQKFTTPAATTSKPALATPSGKNSSPTTNQNPAIQQPVIERIRETVREIQTPGINAAYVDARIAALAASLQRQSDATADANATSFRSVSSSLAASNITGTITNTISSALATITDLTSTTLTATNATFTSATTTNFAATNASTTNLTVSATTTTRGLKVTALDCSSLGNGGTLTTDASGNVVCAADDGGSGSVGGSDTQVQFNDGGSLGADSGLTYNKTADRLTLVYASTTNITASTASTSALVVSVSSQLGTVTSGTWQGTTIGDSFLTKSGDWTGTLDGYEASTLLAGAFSTTSASHFSSLGLAFSTTSSDAWKAQRNFFSTTSASYFSSVGLAFSTTSNDYWKTQNNFFATSSADYWKTANNFFSTTSATYFSSLGLAFATTSSDAWKVQRNFFSTTSVAYYNSVTDLFSTTSAQYFAHSSTTIPKTYSANTFSALQTFGNASTTNFSASYASSTQGFFGSLSIGSLSGFLKATAGSIATALINLASDVTGILPVANGGTGWSQIASGAVVLGNGTGAVATTSAGTNGQVLALVGGTPTWVATTTLATIGGTLSGTQLDGVFSSNGLLARTTTGTYASRTLTGTSNQITVTNGDGVSGNPTLSLPSLLSLTQASSTQQSVFDALYVGRTATTTIRGDGVASIIPYASTTALTVSGTAYFPSSGIWNSSGNVGIGTTSPASLLTVAGVNGWNSTEPIARIENLDQSNGQGNGLLIRAGWSASDYLFKVSQFETTNQDRFIIQPGGNVGIGTTTPQAMLHTQTTGTGDKVGLIIGRNTEAVGDRLSLKWNMADLGDLAAIDAIPMTASVGGLAFRTGTFGSLTEALRINGSGNVGIGTTSPASILHIENSIPTFTLQDNNSAAAGQIGYLSFKDNTNTETAWLGLGTADSHFSIRTNISNGDINFVTAGGSNRLMVDGATGNVGIGTTSPPDLLTVSSLTTSGFIGVNSIDTADAALKFREAGALRWYVGNLGSTDRFYVLDDDVDNGVYLAQDATSWTSNSDARLKENVQTLSVLDRLDGFRAVSFDWKANGTHDLGVIAQELYPLFPELVEKGDDADVLSSATSSNAWGVHYDRMGALALQGVKELNLKLEDLATTTEEIEEGSFPFRFFAALKDRLLAWFADTTNGITDFFARTIHTDELCVGSVCVTEDQFMQVFSPDGMPAAAGSVTSPPPQDPPESEASATSSPSESVTPTESVPPPEEPASDDATEEADGNSDEQPELEDAAAPQEPLQESAEVTSIPDPVPADAVVE